MSLQVSVNHSKIAETFDFIQRLWNLDVLGIKPSDEADLTRDEMLAQKLQDEFTSYDVAKKVWITSLLFKTTPPDLGTNRAKALGLLAKVERTALQNGLAHQVNAAYNEFVDNGFAEEIFEDSEPNQVHYLPGFPVFRKESSTTKTRIVFNASSTTSTGKSLNDCLYTGRNLLPEIPQVLLRFQLKANAISMDLRKMFLTVHLHNGKDYLRYFWRDCNPAAKVRTFRMTSVTFGVVSSPFQAIDVVLKHAKLFETQYPRATKVLKNSLYMDDVLTSLDDPNEATATVEELQRLFEQASMKPHKFSTNYAPIIESVPSDARNPEPVVTALGLLWDTQNDRLSLNLKGLTIDGKPDTKRSFLVFAAKVYDTQGFASPVTMRIKRLFQQLWLQEDNERVDNDSRPSATKKTTARRKKQMPHSSWDRPLSADIQKKWDEIKIDVLELKSISVPRCFFPATTPPDSVELFGFADSSTQAYAACVYLVGTFNGKKTATLAFSKQRAAPLKLVRQQSDHQSIVRLELLSILVLANVSNYVQTAVEHSLTIKGVHLFTDSMINLCRIRRGPANYKLWVANRLEDILRLTNTDQWHHCPSALNPADLPSRGMSTSELQQSKLWWNGPEFITQEMSTWPTEAELRYKTDPEQKRNDLDESLLERMTFAVTKASNPQIQLNWEFVCTQLNRYSDWLKTVKHFARILRMGSKLHKKFRSKPFSVEEKLATEKRLWSLSQQQSFTKDYELLAAGGSVSDKSDLSKYNPYFDKQDCLLRSNTRLVLSNLPVETRTAIILPKNCPIVAKYVLDRHMLHQHAGTGYLHALLKHSFLIPQGRRQIRKIIRTCTTRKCVQPIPLAQQMAPLPALRTDDHVPFNSVAVDLFGPLMVFHTCGLPNCPHPTEEKVYGCLFTCFTSRAVHIELVDNASTEAFLNAFRMFTSRRGVCTTLYSDNGKNFRCASKEIRALYRSINWNAVRKDGVTKNIEWFFSTERAPHQNGLCERLVSHFKRHIRPVVCSARLTKAQLTLILTEIEAVVNGRPLAVSTEDPSDWVPISPFELINGRRLEQIPDPKAPLKTTNYAHLWRRRQAILGNFWRRWSNDYLLEQSIRKVWKTPQPNDLLNRIVLIRDDHLSRNEWKIGKIVRIIPSKDNLVRNVEVKTPTSLLRRPVQKLALMQNV